jgi:hypothetical protein
MDAFEAEIKKGHVKLPKSVQGYAFKRLPNKLVQTYTLRGRKGAATVRFNYVVPNG